MDAILTSAELKAIRWRHCNTCPHLKNKMLDFWVFKPLARCGVCGCFLKAKISLKPMKCPIGKW
ncbi:hypothetical protein BH09BAC1_BH09BAC1_16340 [soil metagenome]